jgi:outer membrane receptor protein involved in Fe transport
MIESVEVITNPSAKYEAEGSSGIINIVLKKEEKQGFNGSVSANTGLPDNHSLGVSLNRRTDQFNFFTQFGAGYRSLPDFNESVNLSLADSTQVLSEGTEFRNERFANITIGADYYLNERNVLTLSGSFAYEDEEQPSETEIRSIGSDGQLISAYTREETTTAGNPKYQYDLQYERRFKNNEDHVLQFSTQGNFFGKKQESTFVNVLSEGVQIDPDQETETDYFQQDFIFKGDYTNPFTEEWTLEAGAQYDINDVGNAFAVFNEDGAGSFVADSNFTNNFEFNQKVLGVYATGAYESEDWGLKLGLRVEQTDLQTLLTTTNEANRQQYTSLFPSLHASYSFSKAFSMQAGYSRRIYRPRLWDLNPFFNIRNNYNIRRGNPNLLPEFADSYELTAIAIFKKVTLNSSIYHLYTTDVIERVSFFQGNVNTTEPRNIGTRNQTGFELNGKYNAADWLSFNGDFNYGYFTRDGQFEEQDFDFSGQQWFTRVTARVKLPADFELEISGDYRSPVRSIQGTRAGFAFMDAGLRKKFWKGKLVANASVRDAFASRVRERILSQPDFYLYDWSQRGRFLAFGLSYSFGKGEAIAYTGRRR